MALGRKNVSENSSKDAARQLLLAGVDKQQV